MPQLWYQRTDTKVFLLFSTMLYTLLVFLLYQNVMKDKSITKNELKDKSPLYGKYYVAFIFLFLFFIYVVISLLACAYYYNHDMQLIRNPRSLNKKVKDMSARQKKHYYDVKNASLRMTLYGCGVWYTGLKIWTLVSTILAYVLYPYAKEKKQMSLFKCLSLSF